MLKRSTVIAISGRAQAGKTTTADFAEKWYKARGYTGVRQVACADALKKLCHDLFLIPKEHLWGTGDDKNNLSPVKFDDLPTIPENLGPIDPSRYITVRQLLQYLGSDIFRQMFPDCWVNTAKQYILDKNITTALITDARFPNEIDSFANDEDFEVYLIRLRRNPLNMSHASETALDNYRPPANVVVFDIDNSDFSFEDKNKRIEMVLRTIESEND